MQVIKKLYNCLKQSVKNHRKTLYTVIAVCYVAICVYFYSFQVELIFNNNTVPKTRPALLEPYAFSWEHDGIKHHGWYIHGKTKKPLIIYLGGNAETISHNIITFYKKFHNNYDILAVEYRGYGSSEGEPSEANIIKDSIAYTTEWMATHNYTSEDIIIIGRSLGSGVAVQLAQHIKPRGIILITPFDSLNAVASLKYPYLPIDYINYNSFRSDRFIDQLSMPALFIIAGNDTLTPPANGLRLARLMGRSPWIATINKATHSNIYHHEETWYDIQLFMHSLFETKSNTPHNFMSQAHFHITSQ